MQVHVFLGLVTYYTKFVLNLPTIRYLLNELLKNNAKYQQLAAVSQPFNRIKNKITSDRCVTHFFLCYLQCYTLMQSLMVSQALLSHVMSDYTDKIIAFVSRTLPNEEKCYSHLWTMQQFLLFFGVKTIFRIFIQQNIYFIYRR